MISNDPDSLRDISYHLEQEENSLLKKVKILENKSKKNIRSVDDLLEKEREFLKQFQISTDIPKTIKEELEDTPPQKAIIPIQAISSLQEKLDSISKQNKKLIESLRASEAESKEHIRFTQKLKEENSRLKLDLTNKEAQLNKLKDLIQNQKTRIGEMEEEIKLLQKEVKSFELYQTQISSESESLSHRLNKTAEENKNLRAKLKDEISAYKEDKKLDQIEMQRLQQELNVANRIKDELMGTYTKQTELIKALQSKNKALQMSKTLEFLDSQFIDLIKKV